MVEYNIYPVSEVFLEQIFIYLKTAGYNGFHSSKQLSTNLFSPLVCTEREFSLVSFYHKYCKTIKDGNKEATLILLSKVGLGRTFYRSWF